MADVIVTTQELREIFDKLISDLEAYGHNSIDIPVSYYWHVLTPDLYNVYQEPAKLGIGDIIDDWAELKKILNGQSEVFSYGLVWLAPILRYIGENKP